MTARGFTLIELLIVVAIVAILATIAIPNFIEAQIRAKIARARADIVALRTAIECYNVDQNAYPSAESNGTVKWLRRITTPLAYIASVDLQDPFTVGASAQQLSTLVAYSFYRYYGFNEMGYTNAATADGTIIPVYDPPGALEVKYYLLFCHGPDGVRSKGANGATFTQQDNLLNPEHFTEFIYDPTNGVSSSGEIFTLGGAPIGRAAGSMQLIK